MFSPGHRRLARANPWPWHLTAMLLRVGLNKATRRPTSWSGLRRRVGRCHRTGDLPQREGAVGCQRMVSWCWRPSLTATCEHSDPPSRASPMSKRQPIRGLSPFFPCAGPANCQTAFITSSIAKGTAAVVRK